MYPINLSFLHGDHMKELGGKELEERNLDSIKTRFGSIEKTMKENKFLFRQDMSVPQAVLVHLSQPDENSAYEIFYDNAYGDVAFLLDHVEELGKENERLKDRGKGKEQSAIQAERASRAFST